MGLKKRLYSGLKRSREIVQGTLDSFKTPEQWVHQVHEKANHALWFVGHIAVVDDFMISLVAKDKASPKAGYPEKFGMGSTPTGNAADYPPIEEVLDYWRDRREALLAVLDGLGDEDFDTRTPADAPPFLATFGAVFQLGAWHEAFHLGQVSVAARALGMPPRI